MLISDLKNKGQYHGLKFNCATQMYSVKIHGETVEHADLTRLFEIAEQL